MLLEEVVPLCHLAVARCFDDSSHVEVISWATCDACASWVCECVAWSCDCGCGYGCGCAVVCVAYGCGHAPLYRNHSMIRRYVCETDLSPLC
ncbi:hypothetical protein JYU34_022775 [Plutella xylostella]|uniref:Secreted protein n=1 Tax=Plutella xylostella TaxID=51655 RepID=A0ABQ7PPL4_PLUXY|nr:hypothetical protein JYU34_022775 [Plutella xylostella]